MQLTQTFKNKVIEALLAQRDNFGGTDAQYAKRFGLNANVYSQIKNGKYRDGLVRDSHLLTIARELDVDPNTRVWRIARTEVFEAIENDIKFCKEHSKAMMLVDEPEIGKTVAGRYLSRTLPNAFYIDCSQAKTKTQFIRALAKAVGVDQVGTYGDIANEIKFRLKVLEQPIIILDEGGDLSYSAFMMIKEFWNATDGLCGWYMMGADGLRTIIEKGIRNEKVGYRELFSRFSAKYMRIVPRERTDKQDFYRKLISDVLQHNVDDTKMIPNLVVKCLSGDGDGKIGGLRRAQTLLIMSQDAA